jgi:hypothetical protein
MIGQFGARTPPCVVTVRVPLLCVQSPEIGRHMRCISIIAKSFAHPFLPSCITTSLGRRRRRSLKIIPWILCSSRFILLSATNFIFSCVDLGVSNVFVYCSAHVSISLKAGISRNEPHHSFTISATGSLPSLRPDFVLKRDRLNFLPPWPRGRNWLQSDPNRRLQRRP